MSKQEEERQQNEANRGQGPGRKQEQQTSDISKIDQQEGEMNNGELGAGLEKKEDHNTTTTRK